MSARVIEGKAIAATLRQALEARIERLEKKGLVPGLAVVLVGEDPASISYVTGKGHACEELGMHSEEHRLPESVTETELLALVGRLNADPAIHGILVQLPLPAHINSENIIEAISPFKDVDGIHPESLGKIMLGRPTFIPCTPHGVVKMLVASGVQIAGAHVVIVGRSTIVGKPLANLLIQRGAEANATVTLCHTGTRNLGHFTRMADILIAAAGRPGLIRADMVKAGAVVIDVGVTRVADASRKRGFRLVGDVAYDEVSEVASAITPVPGGVGPMTITMLMHNTVEAAERAAARGDGGASP
ncbi:MAG TPA: tetrahydrofolate dehydrogenase/cyclohydrolase catalytic domain-containing protein [Spirochaetia bacterium]|nr:tetrahydrofolate dehydrogenase/cyclohydrolase catalytic domain-containing protein [Spirochaetia bacterium]